MGRPDESHLEGSASSIQNQYQGLRAFARVVRLEPETGGAITEEQEFLRFELAVAWVQFQLGTFRAIRGEAYLRDDNGRVNGVVKLPRD